MNRGRAAAHQDSTHRLQRPHGLNHEAPTRATTEEARAEKIEMTHQPSSTTAVQMEEEGGSRRPERTKGEEKQKESKEHRGGAKKGKKKKTKRKK